MIRDIRAGRGLPTGEQRSWLSVFVAIHYLRVPHMREVMNDFINRVSHTMFAVAVAHPGGLESMLIQAGQATPETATEAAKVMMEAMPDLTFQYAKNDDASMLLAQLPDVMRALDEMNLYLGVARPGHSFITGDRPVSTFAPGHGGWETGLGMQHVEVALPLESHICLFYKWTGKGGSYWVEPEQVESVNQRTARYSTRLLVGTSKAQVQRFRDWQQREPGAAPGRASE